MSSPYTSSPQGDGQYGYGQSYQQFPQGGGGWNQRPQGYLEGGPVGFGEAISQGFGNMFNFQGRASRSAYWWFALGVFIVAVVVDIVAIATGIKAIQYVMDAVMFVATLSLQVRRLHDINRSGFWWFIGLIPLVGAIVLLVFDCTAGTPGPNQYG